MEHTPKQTIRVFEEGRNYETTYTKKYKNRTLWARPNPEEIKSFIPGTVEEIMVKAGDHVTAGQEIMIYVAMKMHNVIRAPFAGTVTDIPVERGSRLPRGTVMMIIRREDAAPKKKSPRRRLTIRRT
jgi:pyruvate carboxylase